MIGVFQRPRKMTGRPMPGVEALGDAAESHQIQRE
jgi:hypothetical protein